MKKLAIFLICIFPLAVIFLVFTLRFKANGGIYWTFMKYNPVIVSGDGSNYQTAYELKNGQVEALTNVEIATIRDKYWVRPGRTRADFYHQCYDTLVFAHTNESGHAYDIVTFALPSGTNTVYFDVTAYQR